MGSHFLWMQCEAAKRSTACSFNTMLDENVWPLLLAEILPQITTKQKGRYNTIYLCMMHICSCLYSICAIYVGIKLLLLLLLLLLLFYYFFKLAFITKKFQFMPVEFTSWIPYTNPCNYDNISRSVTSEAWVSCGTISRQEAFFVFLFFKAYFHSWVLGGILLANARK